MNAPKTSDATAALAKNLAAAWLRYVELFGEPPHGTEQQLAALIELIPRDDGEDGGHEDDKHVRHHLDMAAILQGRINRASIHDDTTVDFRMLQSHEDAIARIEAGAWCGFDDCAGARADERSGS